MKDIDIGEHIHYLIATHWEQERIRANPPTCLLTRSASAFASVADPSVALTQAPLSVQIEVANRCECKCVMCQRWTWPKNDSKILTLAEIDALLKDLAEFGVRSVTLSGGEPLLRPDLPEILFLANKYQLASGILTCGLSASDQLLNSIVTLADWVRVSVDASNPHTYTQVRGVDRFGEVESFVMRLNERIGQRCGTGKCQLSVGYTIQKDNLDDALDMIETVKRWNCNSLSYKFAHGVGAYLGSPERIRQFQTQISARNYPQDDGITNIPFLDRFMRQYSTPIYIAMGKPLRMFYSTKSVTCFATYFSALIDAWGDIYPCCHLYHDNENLGANRALNSAYRVGSIREAKFSNLWASSKYETMRRGLSPVNVEDHPECAQCTRHFVQNAFLTDVYGLFVDILNSGDKRAMEQYREIVRELSDAEVAWL